ncbi:hypothetical protein [Streptomyces sp. NBC_01508]|uniref:hypothetical protein n=1 Tax=Streptomyces sp. NBC_01508 TaxID=2903888 RepID=UPI0038671B1F
MKNALRIAAMTGAVAAALVATGLGAQDSDTVQAAASDKGKGKSNDIILAHGSDRLPNTTASDWTTYAEHVVSVTPVAESEIPPTPEEIERGEGIILRNVQLRVDRVVWSKENVSRPAPTSFDWTAYGWAFTGTDTSQRVKMAGEDEPRLESGHSYLMAIDWQEPRCSPGDAPVPGQWRGLGVDSTIPFDNQVIGEGEMEGKPQSAKKVLATLGIEEPDLSLEDKMTGKDTAALDKALDTAPPQTEEQFGPDPAETTCK